MVQSDTTVDYTPTILTVRCGNAGIRARSHCHAVAGEVPFFCCPTFYTYVTKFTALVKTYLIPETQTLRFEHDACELRFAR